MNEQIIVPPLDVFTELLLDNGLFPNNPRLPLVLYKKALNLKENDPESVEEVFRINLWKKMWRYSIYPFHHYHSNTHEVLGIYSGTCVVQVGGDEGPTYEIEKGDVLFFPAGVAHKNVGSTEDFQCVGAYPFDVDYDMFYGKPGERVIADENIPNVPLPRTDPVYGDAGLLFKYWK